MTNQKSSGGKRIGAGRPRTGETLAKDNTKTIRVTFEMAQSIKSGKYQYVMELVEKYQQEIVDNPKSKTSPRYDKLREFLAKIEKNTLTKDVY